MSFTNSWSWRNFSLEIAPQRWNGTGLPLNDSLSRNQSSSDFWLPHVEFTNRWRFLIENHRSQPFVANQSQPPASTTGKNNEIAEVTIRVINGWQAVYSSPAASQTFESCHSGFDWNNRRRMSSNDVANWKQELKTGIESKESTLNEMHSKYVHPLETMSRCP